MNAVIHFERLDNWYGQLCWLVGGLGMVASYPGTLQS